MYLDNSELVFEEENLYTVGPVLVKIPAKAKHFTNALHDSYDEQDLKDLEYDVAEALDETGLG